MQNILDLLLYLLFLLFYYVRSISTYVDSGEGFCCDCLEFLEELFFYPLILIFVDSQLLYLSLVLLDILDLSNQLIHFLPTYHILPPDLSYQFYLLQSISSTQLDMLIILLLIIFRHFLDFLSFLLLLLLL